MARDFQGLRQTMESMAEFNAKFRESALLLLQYVTDEEIRKTRYLAMLKNDIREFVSFSRCKTLNGMIKKTREWEIKLELREKRKPEQVQTVVGPTKRPKTSDTHTRGQQGRGCYAKCSKLHSGDCQV